MKNQSSFFDFAAAVGLTKHLGGINATDQLLQQCNIDQNKYVLDVGCGVGVTPCYIAKKYHCNVMGIDNVDNMIERSKERAKKEDLEEKVSFKVADAQDLPFEDNLFDIVITESVAAFADDKQKAVNEFSRVAKPGGFIGLNESTWIKFPPPPELLDWVSQGGSDTGEPLSSNQWINLLENAQMKEIVAQTHQINLQEESKAIFKRYRFSGMLAILGRMFSLYFKDPAYRKFVKDVQKGGITPKNLDQYFGYGLFVGKK